MSGAQHFAPSVTIVKKSHDERGTDSHKLKTDFWKADKPVFKLAVLLIAGWGSPALAAPIEAGQTLTEQRFEWQSAYSSRSAGTYGQYEVSLQAGTQYEIFTSNPHGGNTTDAYLYLLNSSFGIVASDDDSNGNLQARIVFTPSSTGAYYIRLRAYSSGRYGFCSLSVVGSAPLGPGLPDLIIWGPSASPRIATVTFSSGSCAVIEGMVQSGTRKLLRFSTETRNQGTADLYLGNPATNPQFVWAPCHGHYHFNHYANYRLLDSGGQRAATGLKIGFCLLDTLRWSSSASSRAKYTCSNQGIQKGWGDVYDSSLDGQWIDITGVPDGNYTLEMEVNPERVLPESNYDNNIARIPITIGSPRPVNDNFVNAQGLSGSSASVSGANGSATKEAGEPNHAGNAGGHSLWYFWTAPSSRTVVIDTVGSSFNTLLAVYTGSSVSALTGVASNDDISASTTQSRLAFAPVSGTTYRIAVDGKNGVTGSIVLTLNQNPFNDNFAGCEFIGGANGSVTGSTGSASRESGEPDHAGNRGGRSIWYCWTAPNSASVTFDTIGSTFDTLLAVYTGNSLNSLTPVASNDDISYPNNLQSRVTFSAVATTQYHIAIDGYNGASGNTTLHWNMAGSALFLADASASSAGGDTAVRPSLSYNLLGARECELAIVGQPLHRYTVEVSCNLIEWMPLATTLADHNGTAYFRDKARLTGVEAWCGPSGAAPAQTRMAEGAKSPESRFYRVMEAP